MEAIENTGKEFLNNLPQVPENPGEGTTRKILERKRSMANLLLDENDAAGGWGRAEDLEDVCMMWADNKKTESDVLRSSAALRRETRNTEGK